MNKENFWNLARKVLINKYAIAIYVFAVIMIFIGEHSLIQFVKRGTQIREVEAQIEHTNQQIRQAQRSMNMLDDIDSLERFARERYMMHTDKEDVYIVEP
jgi:cell division protein FtsB